MKQYNELHNEKSLIQIWFKWPTARVALISNCYNPYWSLVKPNLHTSSKYHQTLGHNHTSVSVRHSCSHEEQVKLCLYQLVALVDDEEIN